MIKQQVTYVSKTSPNFESYSIRSELLQQILNAKPRALTSYTRSPQVVRTETEW